MSTSAIKGGSCARALASSRSIDSSLNSNSAARERHSARCVSGSTS
jgi:hypothetical protein